MNLNEAKEYLNSKGYILEDNKELNEGILTIAGGVALGLLALKVVGKVLGVGLKGLSSILTQTNHQVILKVIDRDKDIISAELKEYMMSDEEIAELIENKSITVKQIQEWIERSSNKLIQPEFKANGLRMANDDMHTRQLKSRGFSGGISGGIGAHLENSQKLHEISDKLAKVVYDTIYEVKNESTICEGAYKDIIHQQLAEIRLDQKNEEKSKKKIVNNRSKVLNTIVKESKKFIDDLCDELVTDEIGMKKFDYDEYTNVNYYVADRHYTISVKSDEIVYSKNGYLEKRLYLSEVNKDTLSNFLNKVFEDITHYAAEKY